MGGIEGSRGYLYQAVVAVIEELTSDRWSNIYVEFPTKEDKVDIALECSGKIISAIQVKSSRNSFARADIIDWIKAITNDVDSENYQICVIGQCAPSTIKFINSVKKYYDKNIDDEAVSELKHIDISILQKNNITIKQLNLDQDALLASVRDVLNQYIFQKGYNISYDVLETLSESIVMTKMLLSTSGTYMSKNELDDKILKWISFSSGSELKRNSVFAYHKVGIYNVWNKCVLPESKGIHIKDWRGYAELRQEMLTLCKCLIHEIDSLKTPERSESEVEIEEKERKERSCKAMRKIMEKYPQKNFHETTKDGSLIKENNKEKEAELLGSTEIQKAVYKFCNKHKAEIDENKIIKVKKNATELLNLTLSDDFFKLGSLQEENSMIQFNGPTLIGTDAEKKKYSLLCELFYEFSKVDLLDLYIKTYDDIVIVPLAIENISDYADENIKVIIVVNSVADLIDPIHFPVFHEAKGFEGIVHDLQFVCKMLELPENVDISLEKDFSQPIPLPFIMPRIDVFGRCIEPESTEEDYIDDLESYISKPTKDKKYVFNLSSLRAKETKWLGKIILLKNPTSPIVLRYSIISGKSDGLECGDVIIYIADDNKE